MSTEVMPTTVVAQARTQDQAPGIGFWGWLTTAVLVVVPIYCGISFFPMGHPYVGTFCLILGPIAVCRNYNAFKAIAEKYHTPTP